MKQKLLFLIFTFFLISTSVHATSAYITGNEVRFRKGPGTNFEALGVLNSNTIIELLNTNKTVGAGCNEGWYNIKYNNQTGYVCSSYVGLERVDTGDYLPWISPKKAIYGGATFVSSGYISKGQNTSYLKKFNVNPNGYYAMFNHQYMANLAAPMNEASSAYKSYKENNMLIQPLKFFIPIYKNMPAYTTHPVTGKEEGGTSVIKDQAFEDTLTKQGFDESYKKWLRLLHEKYPNWTFEALHTNIDFNYAVEREKPISSIQNTCIKCIETNPIENTEGNWYVANNETVSYFLDPRNFLMEDSILMFEDLKFAEVYTESAVKSVLKGTFMENNDPIDNLPYSKIFYEAGKTHNISPIYLASLSRQEIGAKVGTATSGKRFTYKGNTYEGFYNFFNIGAYSSEENPCLAGLVYASAGADKDTDGVFKGNIIPSETPPDNNDTPSKPVIIPTQTYLNQMNLKRKGNYITNVSTNETVLNLKNKTDSKAVTFKNANGETLGNSEKLSTGSTIIFQNGEKLEVVLYGDLTGDGKINSADLLRMRQVLLNKVNLSGAYYEAAHVYTQTGKPTSADLLRIRQHLLGKSYINQA